MTTAAPAATQHMTALDRANEVRRGMADVRRALAAGSVLDLLVLGEIPEHVPFADRMELETILVAAPKIGLDRAAKILRDATAPSAPPLPPRKRLGALTARQRTQLARACRERVPSACSPPAAGATQVAA